MRYAIQVNSAFTQSNAGYIACRFCETALAQGHEILRVFFYADGIYQAVKDNTPFDDEINLTARWNDLANRYGVDLVVCVSAAQRRGLLHPNEARRRGNQDDNLSPGFRIGGLGQWLEAMITADRVIVF